MSVEPKVISGEVIEDDIPFVVEENGTGADIERRPSQEVVSLFGAGGPAMALQQVEQYANALKDFVKTHDLTLEMEDGSDYLLTPAWEGLGQMMGIFAEVEMCEPFKDGWHAKAFAHTRDGERLTARFGLCSRAEPGKKWKPETEIQAMAQTRACRNALKAAMNIVVNAAGYDAAPPEERTMSPKQRANIFALLAKLNQFENKGKDGWKDWLTDATLKRFGQRISGLNRLQAVQVIAGLEGMVGERENADPETSEWKPEGFEEAESIDL